MQLQRPLSELQYYKVLGVINTVMLVLNTLEDRCYIMKVLHKSPCPVSDVKCPIVPQVVPYMVKLHGYFETESAVFLLLQHARYENHLTLCYLRWCYINIYYNLMLMMPELTISRAKYLSLILCMNTPYVYPMKNYQENQLS